MKRVKILFQGIVQGVGFRPFLYKYATKHKLTGFVLNNPQGVILEVEGDSVDEFIKEAFDNLPPLSEVEHHEIEEIPIKLSNSFKIIASENTGRMQLMISPDIAICEDCKREMFEPTDRRFHYPFINCTNCGPRFTIIKDIPYDRPNTTMKPFPICENCREEYENPLDRRYHAQPVACFDCGPLLTLKTSTLQPQAESSKQDGTEKRRKESDELLSQVADLLKQGKIIAVKGLGGYHLACLAYSDAPVERLRKLKNRGNKPFALMGSLEMIADNCYLSNEEKSILTSPSAPIMLLEKKAESKIAEQVAPNQNTIGFMIPYTPLHLLLLDRVNQPLVMTSANFSDEPIIYNDDHKDLDKLADAVLSHNRKIHIFADDSVGRVFYGKFFSMRRSRGFVPLPIKMPITTERTILSIGPMLKTTFTFFKGEKAIMSQYIATTDSLKCIEAERKSIRHFMKIFEYEPDIIVMDKHPNYPNRLLAKDFPKAEIIEVQHHKAHIGSLLAENSEREKIIGVAFDGTGYGDDGKIWGGEFFVGNYKEMDRFGHLRYVFLPSGDKAIRESWRFALSMLYAMGKTDRAEQFAKKFGQKGKIIHKAIISEFGGIETSSVGRLFDGVSSLLGIGNYNTYDGELPSILQSIAEKKNDKRREDKSPYNFLIVKEDEYRILDLLPAIDEMLKSKESLTDKAYNFHLTLAFGTVEMCKMARDRFNINKVGLSGGVFQNILLLDLVAKILRKNGFEVLLHSQIPPNDSGISLGQAFITA